MSKQIPVLNTSGQDNESKMGTASPHMISKAELK